MLGAILLHFLLNSTTFRPLFAHCVLIFRSLWGTGSPGTDGHIRVRPNEMDRSERFAADGSEHEELSREQPEWAFTYLSVIIALTDVGEGDGATTVVPGRFPPLFL